MSNLAVDFLIKQRDRLVDERNKMTAQFNKEISDLETAIEQIYGKKVWEMGADYHYDDENPNYIKASQEEI